MHVFKHPNSEFPLLNEFSFERRQRVDKEKEAKSSQTNADNESIRKSKKSFSWSSDDDDDDDDFNVVDQKSKTVKEKMQVDHHSKTRHSKFKKY